MLVWREHSDGLTTHFKDQDSTLSGKKMTAVRNRKDRQNGMIHKLPDARRLCFAGKAGDAVPQSTKLLTRLPCELRVEDVRSAMLYEVTLAIDHA